MGNLGECAAARIECPRPTLKRRGRTDLGRSDLCNRTPREVLALRKQGNHLRRFGQGRSAPAAVFMQRGSKAHSTDFGGGRAI
jgi:hypothetical protein